jgi:hypothetical protein
MTVTLAIASPGLIVMAVDSAVTVEFTDSVEYTTGRKSYFFKGVGCVTTWGARDQNRVGDFLHSRGVSSQNHTVFSLADLVQEYLTTHFRPDQLGLSDVGYHIAGFDPARKPRLFHIFWGFDRPRPPGQTQAKYERYEHSPQPGTTFFLFNGRNDLAGAPISAMITEIQSGKKSRFDISQPSDLVRFADFVLRFASEITPEVGPPFLTYLIGANNVAIKVENREPYPLPKEAVDKVIADLGRWEKE